MRAISNFSTGFPHLRGHISEPRGDDGRGAPRRGLRDLRGRQVAPLPDGGRLGRRPVRPVAVPAGLRPLLRLPRRRDRPVLPRPHLRQPPGRRRPRTADEGYHLSEDLVDKTHRVRPRLDVDPPRPPVLHLPRLRRHPRAAPGAARVPRPSTAAASTTAGTSARAEWFARQQELGLLPEGTELAPRNPGVEAWDDLPENHRGARRPPPGGVRRVPRPHRRPDRSPRRRARRDRPARQHHRRGALRQRRQPGGRPVRRAPRDEVLQLHPRDARRGDRPRRRHRRAAQPLQLPVGLGPGRQHAVQVVQAEHPRGRRPRALHRALASGRHRRAAACATSSTTSTTSPRRCTS